MELRSLIGIFGGPSTGLRSELVVSFVLLGQASFGMLRVGLRPGDTHHKLLGDKLLERGFERCERGESENPRILLAWAPAEDLGGRGESENPRILLVGAIAEDVVSLRLGFFLIGDKDNSRSFLSLVSLGLLFMFLAPILSSRLGLNLSILLDAVRLLRLRSLDLDLDMLRVLLRLRQRRTLFLRALDVLRRRRLLPDDLDRSRRLLPRDTDRSSRLLPRDLDRLRRLLPRD